MKMIVVSSLLLFSFASFAKGTYTCTVEISKENVMQLTLEKFRTVKGVEQVGVKFFFKDAPDQVGFFDVCTPKLGPDGDRVYGCSETTSTDTMLFSFNKKDLTGTLYAIGDKPINTHFSCK